MYDRMGDVAKKVNNWTKEEFLNKLASIDGVYVPSLYDVSYNADGTIKEYIPREGAPAKVKKRRDLKRSTESRY